MTVFELFCLTGTPQTNRTNYNAPSHATPERSHDHYSRSHHDLSYRDSPHKGAASRPTTLALGTPPGSPDPHRSGPPRDAYYHTPQKNKASSAATKSYQTVNRHVPMEKSQADTNIGSSSGQSLYHGSSPSKPLHVHVDPGTAGRAEETPPPLPDPPAHYSPLKLTQYDKDVAMFKGPEPPSQVSSSTDSGYGHAHIYERVPGDFSRKFEEYSSD